MIIIKVLFKTVVIPFYKTNAGFFFLIFVTIFASVQPPELILTYPFIKAIGSTPAFLMIFFILTALYARKCFRFLIKCIDNKHNGYFAYLPLIGKSKFIGYVGLSFCILLLPFLFYGLLITITSLMEVQWVTSMLVLVFFTATACIAGHLVYLKNTRLPGDYKSTLSFSLIAMTKYYYIFHINYLMNERKVFFLTTKAISLFVLFVSLHFYSIDEHLTQLIYFGLLTSSIFNNLLIYEIVQFEDRFLSIIRNLPIRMTVFYVNTITLSIILIPEIVFLVLYHGLSTGNLLYVIFMLGVSTSIHVNAYLSKGSMCRFLKITIAIFVSLFFAILVNIPMISIIILCFLSSISLFHRFYFTLDAGVFYKEESIKEFQV